ncbi:MAG: hypothetical protein WDA59_00200 [Methanofastidiosum sp.]|jgi:hypothetical protein
MEKRQRVTVISFSQEFEEEYNFIRSLADKGIKKSHWICTAIRDKMINQQETDELIKELEGRVKLLEEKARERSNNIVYLTKESDAVSIEQDLEEELKKVAASIPF